MREQIGIGPLSPESLDWSSSGIAFGGKSLDERIWLASRVACSDSGLRVVRYETEQKKNRKEKKLLLVKERLPWPGLSDRGLEKNKRVNQ